MAGTTVLSNLDLEMNLRGTIAIQMFQKPWLVNPLFATSQWNSQVRSMLGYPSCVQVHRGLRLNNRHRSRPYQEQPVRMDQPHLSMLFPMLLADRWLLRMVVRVVASEKEFDGHQKVCFIFSCIEFLRLCRQCPSERSSSLLPLLFGRILVLHIPPLSATFEVAHWLLETLHQLCCLQSSSWISRILVGLSLHEGTIHICTYIVMVPRPNKGELIH